MQWQAWANVATMVNSDAAPPVGQGPAALASCSMSRPLAAWAFLPAARNVPALPESASPSTAKSIVSHITAAVAKGCLVEVRVEALEELAPQAPEWDGFQGGGEEPFPSHR